MSCALKSRTGARDFVMKEGLSLISSYNLDTIKPNDKRKATKGKVRKRKVIHFSPERPVVCMWDNGDMIRAR